MKRFLKLIVRACCLPLIIIVNKFTISFCKKIKGLLVSNLFSVLYCKNYSMAYCKDYPNVIGGKYFNIMGTVCFGKRNRVECYDNYMGKRFSPKLTIEDGVVIMDDCHIGCINEVIIGENTLIASKVMIIDYSHGLRSHLDIKPTERELVSKGRIVVGKNCWIGENSTILPGVEIGDNCVIGANSVVTKSFKDKNLMIAGNPAKVIIY